MTVTPSSEPTSSSHTYTSPRSGLAQMDEADGLRFRPGSDDTLSLASSSTEHINLEDNHYTLLREALEIDAQNLEAESWSLAVDQNYLNALNKEAIKRQDVIYELMKTEMHHVRNLKILLHVYMHELKQSLLMEDTKLKQLFAGVEDLLSHHQHFLNTLKMRQSQSQEEGSPNNYYITQLGDILKSQFSGTLGEGMIMSYSVFCSRQNEGVNFVKEQSLNNKKLQFLIRKIGQLSIVRRMGIPECFLLVTQRITKYPVLVERIIQNTDADTDEHKSLVEALTLIKEAIFQVNDRVSEYEKSARLKEIIVRLEPKCPTRLKDGRHFRREDLNHSYRTLLHEGNVAWKSSGKQKDVQAVLLSDMLLLLQEKDQKLVFATMDNKPPVISLQRLIVREVAHEDRAMYLICAFTSSLPEMYEIHMGSKEERVAWTNLIRMAVDRLREEELYHEEVAAMQEYQDMLKSRDDQISHSLQEKLQIIANMYENLMEHETPHKGLLLRGTAADLQQGEALLNGAINEVENLQNLLFMRIKDPGLLTDESEVKQSSPRRSHTFGVADSPPVAGTTPKNGDGGERVSDSEDCPQYRSHSSSDDQPQDVSSSEDLEQSADGETDALNPDCCNLPEEEVCDRVIMLAQRLYSLQAVVAQQDSQIELQHVFHSKSKQPSRNYSNLLLEQEKQRNLKKQEEELANLHKLQAQHREEQQRWEKEKERQRIEMETLKAELLRREEDCKKAEEGLNQEKAELERQKEEYQQNLETLKKSTKLVEKEKERLIKEKDRVEKLMSKYGHGYANYDNPAQSWSLSSNPSFRGSIINGAGTLTIPSKPYILPTNPLDVPPKVPPRRESISPKPAKTELPAHLISATNQVLKAPAVQQKIPDKLATKGKEKGFKVKKSHQRAHSAAYIDVDQVVPIRVTGKEGGSLRSNRKASPQRIYRQDIFKSPGSPAHSVKPSQSFSTNKRSNGNDPPPPPPPTPPPFPADVVKKEKKDTPEKGKEKVIFL